MHDQRVSDVDRTIQTIEDDEEVALPENCGEDTIIGPKWIGNVRCFWHDKEGKPRLTIGPNWGFTIGLGLLVSGALYVSVTAMIGMYKAGAEWYYQLGGAAIVVFGLSAFFRTFLGDPGIPAEIYRDRARPMARPVSLPEFNDNGDSLCRECNVYLIPIREHCGLCNVCIDNCDHHCVFYSKCIG